MNVRLKYGNFIGIDHWKNSQQFAQINMLTQSEISSRCLSPLLSGDVEDVVPADEGVPVLVLQLAVAVLLRLLQSDVHVAVQAGQHAPSQGLIYCYEIRW